MMRGEYQSASFMMLCIGDFSSKLYIPKKFMTKYREAVQVSMTLETDYSSECWDVKIKNINSDFYMKDGWPEFVNDNHLDGGDFLTFRFSGNSTFKVSIYRSDGFPRRPSFPTSSGGEDHVDERGIKRGREQPRKSTPEIPPTRSAHVSRRKGWVFKEDNPLYFEAILKRHHRCRFNLPQEFSKAANMKVKKQVRMVYEGNRPDVSVVVDPRPEGYRVDLTKGWTSFRKDNGLERGNMYSFEFNPDDNVIHVKEVAPRKRRRSR